MNQVESIYLGFWAAVTGAVCGSFVCCMTERIYDKGRWEAGADVLVVDTLLE